jgi:hypothetical protein
MMRLTTAPVRIVTWRPKAGMNKKALKKQPAAAPRVLKAYKIPISPPMNRGERVRAWLNNGIVAPIRRVGINKSEKESTIRIRFKRSGLAYRDGKSPA